MIRRPNNTFDDETNDWLREHADDLKGIEDARHLKANPIEDPLDEDKPAVPADPACAECGGPIFEEFVDLKRPDVCARPKCQKKRRKLEKEQAKAAAELADPAAAAKPASKSKPAKARRERALRDDYDLEPGLEDARDAVDDMNDLVHKVFVEDPLEAEREEREYQKEFGRDSRRTGSTEKEIDDKEVEEAEEVEEGVGDEVDDEDGLDPEGTMTSRTKVKPKPTSRIRTDGAGLVPTAGDLYDDDTPLLVRVRKGSCPARLRPYPARFSVSEPLKSCEAHGVAKCPTCFPEE